MILSSRRFLKLFSDGAVFRSTESRFHFWITLYEKKFCRCLLPFVANSFTRRAPFLACLTSQNADGSIRVIPFRILKTLMRSPQSLRCCSVMRPSIFLLSSEFFDFHTPKPSPLIAPLLTTLPLPMCLVGKQPYLKTSQKFSL